MDLRKSFNFFCVLLLRPLKLIFCKLATHLREKEEDENTLDLMQFLPDSLNLQVNMCPAVRLSCSKTFRDPLEHLFKRDPLEILEGDILQQSNKVQEEVVETPIQEFYKGAVVFISGGTGFIGKILIEKLIRSIPHISKIYLLIRAKRGKTSEQRFEQLLDDQIFQRMKNTVPDYRSKISYVTGDISEPSLGLSASDRQMLVDSINLVFHSAADVRFIEPLKEAISSNVLGSQRMLELAKDMTQLKAYVHVSTAYSQCVRRVVPEAVVKLSLNYKHIINTVQSMSAKEIEENLKRIMQGWPNTYTFSKAVCEDMILEEKGEIPICIFRPAAVLISYKEPVRGWTDNVYGPMGILLLSGLGITHCFPMDQEIHLDIVPVDFVVNCMIACAWNLNNERCKNNSIPVYNYVSDRSNATNWKCVIDTGLKYADSWPYLSSIWYISFFPIRSVFLDNVAHFFLHTIPGVVLDKIAVWTGRKPRLTKIYDRLHTVKKHLKYFSRRIWEFDSENVSNLWASLTEEDKNLFFFNVKDINTKELYMIGKLGSRYYFLKEKMETLPTAERKNRRLYWLHIIFKLICGLALLKAMVFTARIIPI